MRELKKIKTENLMEAKLSKKKDGMGASAAGAGLVVSRFTSGSEGVGGRRGSRGQSNASVKTTTAGMNMRNSLLRPTSVAAEWLSFM